MRRERDRVIVHHLGADAPSLTMRPLRGFRNRLLVRRRVRDLIRRLSRMTAWRYGHEHTVAPRSLFVPDAVANGRDRTIASSTAARIKEASGRRGCRKRVPGSMARHSYGWPIVFQWGSD
jgi:hypothetical protein